ncbi:unnamed protein product (macronuclear) [Paramecium tetraurelia]|uniref:Uncharacterized protein n=1 Tax=Paramecium tetraurelia TaxID=5888 RepID=A0BTX4_PARTE|nr:uncharacterized protein GSPATT00032223001 [Paramecium tetraurelia]CAK61991.1 unnamed protein product [Paramecium tetraurelia]|eukprot:XP_001429389.1 hypothetical protein (macronuclear) [Paramecium tetraurelia strain d4-2]
MKRSYNIDITNDPLYEQLQSKQTTRRNKRQNDLRIQTQPSVDMERVYDALNFQEDLQLPSTATNNSLLKYIKKQEHEVQLVKNKRKQTSASRDNSVWLGDLQESVPKTDDIPDVQEFLDGRTRELMIRTSHENKKRISNIMLRLEDNQKELVSRHKSYVNELRFSSYNKEVQNQELEHYITLGQNDNPNLNIKLISSKILQSGRNSSYQGHRQPFKQLNLQQVKEKIILDMLRKDVNCKSDPLRMQFFNLYRIIMQNRTIKSRKEKEVMDLVNKSESQRKETIYEKRQLWNLNRMRFTFREKESNRSLLNKSLDERMNKNQIQKKNFKKFLEQLKTSQLYLNQCMKEQLEILRQKLLNQQILMMNDIRAFERTPLHKLLISYLKL